MIYSGWDISKTATGWAVTDGKAWETGVLRCPIKPPFEMPAGAIDAGYAGAVADWLRLQIYALVGVHRPIDAVIEQPMPGNSGRTRLEVNMSADFAGQAMRRVPVGGTSFGVTHFTHGLAVQAASIFVRLGIPVVYAASQSWRSTVGIGRPPRNTKDHTKWYKEQAIAQCGLRGIPVKGADAADAACLLIHRLAAIAPELLYRPGQLNLSKETAA